MILFKLLKKLILKRLIQLNKEGMHKEEILLLDYLIVQIKEFDILPVRLNILPML